MWGRSTSSASFLCLVSGGCFYFQCPGAVQYITTGSTNFLIIILCFLVWILERGFVGLKRRKRPNLAGKMLIVLNGNYRCYLFIVVVASAYFFLSRHTLSITDETQAKWNNLLQILSQEFVTFYLTMCDFTFQPVFRYLNICDMYSIKSQYFFNPLIICNFTHTLFGQCQCVTECFCGGLCCSFNIHKWNEIHVPCEVDGDILDLLSDLLYFARESYSALLFWKH